MCNILPVIRSRLEYSESMLRFYLWTFWLEDAGNFPLIPHYKIPCQEVRHGSVKATFHWLERCVICIFLVTDLWDSMKYSRRIQSGRKGLVRWSTCPTQVGALILSSTTEAPHATETDRLNSTFREHFWPSLSSAASRICPHLSSNSFLTLFSNCCTNKHKHFHSLQIHMHVNIHCLDKCTTIVDGFCRALGP